MQAENPTPEQLEDMARELQAEAQRTAEAADALLRLAAFKRICQQLTRTPDNAGTSSD